MKVKVFYSPSSLFSCARQYMDWIDKNSDIEVISTIGDDQTIVVTYRDHVTANTSPIQTL
ncbi:hypothetical protein D3C81_173620 [compost metagenome]